MKTKLAQIISNIIIFNRRYLQFASLAVMMVGFMFTQAPSDGGIGPC